jgi:predicted outer membrane repeat protein
MSPSLKSGNAANRRLQLEALESREVPAVYTVNGLADTIAANSQLTLREAISLNVGALTFNQLSAAEKAQVVGTVGSNDSIRFASLGTISLGSDLPTLNKKLIIEGPDSGQLTIDGLDLYRPISTAAASDVTLTGLRLSHGHTIDSGGAALNNGKLTASRVEFDNNKSDKHGAAIENNGTLVIDQSYFHDNTASKVGGAVDNNASATITNSTFSNNAAINNGGAIWSNGTLALNNVTLVNNHAANFGGAIRATSGTTTISSSTIVGNDADSDGSGGELGGGISNGGTTLVLNNTVVALNTRNQKAVGNDLEGAANGTFNFIGVSTNLTGITNGTANNRVGTAGVPLNPMLQSLASNGGFTPTRLPAPGSPLIGSGASLAVAGLYDQRGVARTGGATTVGAVEIGKPQAYAVGADAGVAPVVQLFNPDGSKKATLQAFESNFAGGVRTAAADVNGDGVADIIAGTGTGRAAEVRVFDGATNQPWLSIPVFEGFLGGLFVSTGDFNHDGHADIVVSPDQGGGPRVSVFSGADGTVMANFFGITDPAFRGGARTAVGDMNGDGTPDIYVSAGFGGGPRVTAFDGTTLVNATPVKLFNDIFVFEPTLRNGAYLAAGDLDGDGKSDLIAGAGPGGGPRVYALSGAELMIGAGSESQQLANFFGGNPANRDGIRIVAKNLDGDNRTDIVVGDGGSGSQVTTYLGKLVPVSGIPVIELQFNAFPGFSGGVFVG